ncbi:MAG: acyl-CoA reductase [Bacteroidetes bacterium]|nr:acyl-CoA reductase [Bacteroidota bacterium]
MKLQDRISLLARLGSYMQSQEPDWLAAQERASRENGWFIPSFLSTAIDSIAKNWLTEEALTGWTATAQVPSEQTNPQLVGLVMAGNIPLVGFHDWLCVFITGNSAQIKLSSKDKILFAHLLNKLSEWAPSLSITHQLAERLIGCNAYIATGSNNSSRYFNYYFSRYPHIIRKHKTTVGVLQGNETVEELEQLAMDVHLYFGLGCRNVTKLYLPSDFNFIPLLEVFKKYNWLSDFHKYKNNYDYNLALYILNKQFYMTNGSILLVEEKNCFAPVSQLNYAFVENAETLALELKAHPDVQAVVGRGYLPFGQSQHPSLLDYADGVNTLAFLNKKMLNWHPTR